MVKLLYNNFGSNWLMRLIGTQDEIQQEYNSIYNREGTNSDLNLEGEDGYFWTKPKQLLQGFKNIEMAKIVNKLDLTFGRYDSNKDLTDENNLAFLRLAEKRAKERFDSLQRNC